jgi:hypothetical protein
MLLQIGYKKGCIAISGRMLPIKFLHLNHDPSILNDLPITMNNYTLARYGYRIALRSGDFLILCLKAKLRINGIKSFFLGEKNRLRIEG